MVKRFCRKLGWSLQDWNYLFIKFINQTEEGTWNIKRLIEERSTK